MQKLREMRPDLRSLEDIDNELTTELLNGFIIANDEVLKSLASFVQNPNYRSFARVVSAMRKDLGTLQITYVAVRRVKGFVE